MKTLMNAFKSVAQQATQSRAATRHGIVTSYDPNTYAVKVKLQPEGVLTGWIPLKSAWVGNGWGLFCPPSIGDAIEIDFQEDDSGNGSAGWRFYNEVERPLPCPSGECWLVHKSGSFLKFRNDGSIELHAAAELNATVSGNAHLTVAGDVTTRVSGNITETASNITLNGNVTINGALSQGQGSNGGAARLQGPLAVVKEVTANGISLTRHTHSGVKPGGGNTGKPQ